MKSQIAKQMYEALEGLNDESDVEVKLRSVYLYIFINMLSYNAFPETL